jgi:hypothetical protein
MNLMRHFDVLLCNVPRDYKTVKHEDEEDNWSNRIEERKAPDDSQAAEHSIERSNKTRAFGE